MQLTAADFQPLIDVLTDNMPVIIGLIVTMAGFSIVLRLVKRFGRF